jgi:hypothetical protein
MRYTLVFCVMGFLAACGGDGSGAGYPAPTPTPTGPDPAAIEACQTFIEAQYCPKYELCVGGSHADCVGQVTLQIDCGMVKQLGANFPRCQRELAALTCAVFLSGNEIHMPASCDGIFLR